MNEPVEKRWRRLAASRVDERIDAVCDDFEQAWINGKFPDPATYLPLVDEADRAVLLQELQLVDVEFRRRRHRQIDKSAHQPGPTDLSGEFDTVDLSRDLDRTTPLADRHHLRSGPSSGRRAGRLEFIERIGAGAGGEVWKAYDPRLRRTVAVKIAHASSEEELERFVREGQTVAQLRHPRIVAVHEAWCGHGAAYLVTDFYAGGDLKFRLAQGPIGAARAAELCATLADALHYAHECGVIHRDLKPANVLLDANGEPHIADFGLAKWADDARQVTLDGQLLGTVAYMSPEQARGHSAEADLRTDVYSLGVMLYEMLTGACPFMGDQTAVLHAILNHEPVRPRALNRTISRDLETICLKAIDKVICRRYAAAGEMAADLRCYLRGEAIVARRRGVISRSWRYVQRRPAIAACVFLSIAALGALAWAHGLRAKNRELLGLRTVTLATEPAGARVAFVPLTRTTLDPIPSGLIAARGRSPVTQDLKPGDYLVVVALDDGRFQEVRRHVPGRGETRGSLAIYDYWTTRSDGGIDLKAVNIPDRSVTDEMVLIEVKAPPTTSFTERRSGRASVQSFYVDRHEVSVAESVKAYNDPQFIPKRPPNFAAIVSYARAMRTAEIEGKRLPSAAEYEYAATAGGKQLFPWGDDPPEKMDPDFDGAVAGPVGEPQFDRLTLDPRVSGLCSNAPEWTASVDAEVSAKGWPVSGDQVQAEVAATCRIVKGAAAFSTGAGTSSPRSGVDPRANGQVRIDSPTPAIGFRCYRSVKPHLTPEDFDAIPSVSRR